VVVEARFAVSESAEADLRAVLDVVSIPPSGKHGSMGVVLDAIKIYGGSTNGIGKLHYVDSDGFEEVDQGIWMSNGESDDPSLTVDLEIGEMAETDPNYGTYGSTVFASYATHVNGVPTGSNARYLPDDELDIPDDAATPVPVEINIIAEGPAFGLQDPGEFVVFGPHERARLSSDGFELHIVGMPEYIPPNTARTT